MSGEHLSQAMLDGYTSRTLSASDLEQVDRHLTGCQACRDALLERTLDGSSLLNVIQFETRRHLSYKQLEALLEQKTPDRLDDLARLHLSECESCQRELADLQAFEVTLAKPATRPQVVVKPPAMWRLLFWPVTGLAGAVATAFLVLVNTGVVGTRAVQIVVTLASSNPEPATERVQSLTGGPGGATLPAEVARRLEEAIRRAAISGEPQTIEFTVSAADYDSLSRVTTALGAVQSAPADASRPGRQQVKVSLTIRPPTDQR